MRKLVYGGVIIFLLGLLLVDSKIYASAILGKVIPLARENGVSISTTEPDLVWLGVADESVTVSFAGVPLPLELKPLRVTVQPTSLLQMSPKVVVDATLLEGSLFFEGRIDQKRLEQGKGSLKKVQLGNLGQLQALGITSGELSIDLENLAVSGNHGLPTFSAHYTLQDLRKPSPTKLSPLLTGLPFPIPVPDFAIHSFTGKVSGSEGSFSFSKLSLHSSHGTVEGEASGSKEHTVRGSLRVTLSERGQKDIAPFLPMISGGGLSEKSTVFRVLLSGTTDRLRVTYQKESQSRLANPPEIGQNNS